MADSPLSVSRPLLLSETLGFSPQLLLDDIINVANNAVQDGVNGMEEFLQNWTDKRILVYPSVEMENIQEVEQGLVAFQTLLEYHTDIAFDFFEAWSLRNIFVVPPDLDVVLPHQEGLDLSIDMAQAEQREKELTDEIEELRNEIDNQRLTKRQLTRALHISSTQRRRAEQRLSDLLSLLPSSLDRLGRVPSKIPDMFEAVQSLESLEPVVMSSLSQAPQSEAGKRVWEASKTGYLNWAVAKLVKKAKNLRNEGDVDNLRGGADAVAKVQVLKEALTGIKTEFRQRSDDAAG
ncbi:hypothetical protein AX15_007093 [Amanita polypyramis BW_CC]|nr:hypothetical protein AX15_007093 [Amanita polypyramis BW_CC]